MNRAHTCSFLQVKIFLALPYRAGVIACSFRAHPGYITNPTGPEFRMPLLFLGLPSGGGRDGRSRRPDKLAVNRESPKSGPGPQRLRVEFRPQPDQRADAHQQNDTRPSRIESRNDGQAGPQFQAMAGASLSFRLRAAPPFAWILAKP